MADVEQVWDVTTDPDNPQPLVWPKCSAEDCRTPWVWQQFMSLSQGYVWAWARNCKHKKAEPVLMTKDGPYVNDPS